MLPGAAVVTADAAFPPGDDGSRDSRKPMGIRDRSLMLRLIRGAAATAIAVALSLQGVAPAAAAAVAQKNQGLQGGWAVGDGGDVAFVHSAYTQLPYMKEAGAGWVRINFRLGACYPDWRPRNADGSLPAATCNGRTAVEAYGDVIGEAKKHNLKVLGLLSNESKHTPAGTDPQALWTANNHEKTGGDGDNAYIREFAADVAGRLAGHFNGAAANRPLVDQWQVWNEPNAWTSTVNGDPWGGTFMYQSNYAQLLKQSHGAIKAARPDAAVVAAGILGHDQGGVSAMVLDPQTGRRREVTKRGDLVGRARPTTPTRPLPPEEPGARPSGTTGTATGTGATPSGSGGAGTTASTTCVTAYADRTTGADYLCTLYQRGIQLAGWTAGAYPMDDAAQQIYVDVGGPTTATKLGTFLADFRNAQLFYEGSATAKKVQITEFGWRTDYVSYKTQSDNLRTSYQKFKGTGYVGRAYWFNVQDIPEGGLYYGLKDTNGTSKPSFRTYQLNATY
jgi:hypothetical protein